MNNIIVTSVELSNNMTAGAIFGSQTGVSQEECSYSFQFQNGQLTMQAWVGNDKVLELA